MASLTWNALGGFWNDPANWAVISGTDSIPSATTDVLIAAPLNYVVTVAGGQAVHNATINANGARVLISGTLDLGGTLALVSGGLTLGSSGVLRGGTLAAQGRLVTGAGGTLDGVAVQGPLTIDSGSSFGISGGFSLSGMGGIGPGLLTGWQDTFVHVLDDETWSNATLDIGRWTIDVASGASLTLSATVVTTLDTGGPTTLSGNIVNFGTITSDTQHGVLSFTSDFRNDGWVQMAPYSLHVAGDLTNSGTIVAGDIRIGGDLLGAGVVSLVDILDVTGTITAGTVISVARSGTGVQAAAIDPAATIEAHGTAVPQVAITSLPFDGNINAFWSGTPAGGTLTIKDGLVTEAEIFMTGINPGATFSVGGGAAATVIDIANAACFLAGTRIRTLRGDIAVEDLRPGDLVPALRAGRPLPVVWIGHRRLRAHNHPAPAAIWPVVIHANAIADGIPCRDLFLSPEHAVFLHGALVPVRHLVNGTSIQQVVRAEMRYFHVELPVHDLILSECLPTESYLDTGNRSDFENGGDVVSAHPLFATADAIWRARACAPQLRAGPGLDTIRKVLDRRAERIGRAGRSPRAVHGR